MGGLLTVTSTVSLLWFMFIAVLTVFAEPYMLIYWTIGCLYLWWCLRRMVAWYNRYVARQVGQSLYASKQQPDSWPSSLDD